VFRVNVPALTRGRFAAATLDHVVVLAGRYLISNRALVLSATQGLGVLQSKRIAWQFVATGDSATFRLFTVQVSTTSTVQLALMPTGQLFGQARLMRMLQPFCRVLGAMKSASLWLVSPAAGIVSVVDVRVGFIEQLSCVTVTVTSTGWPEVLAMLARSSPAALGPSEMVAGFGVRVMLVQGTVQLGRTTFGVMVVQLDWLVALPQPLGWRRHLTWYVESSVNAVNRAFP